MIAISHKTKRVACCMLALGLAGGTIAPPLPASAESAQPFVVAGAKAGGPGTRGWQGEFVYTPPTGAGGVFFHYPCPASSPIAVNGGYYVNDAGLPGFNLVGNFSRANLAYNEWGWSIRWSGGAPAGTTVTFNVYCLKKNPTQ